MRTAPQKLRNRSNANQANLTQSSPRTRVNRYIGRLIEARQTESDTADLNFLTLMYKCSEREQRVRVFTHSFHAGGRNWGADVCFSLLSGVWDYTVPPGSWWVLHQRSGPLSDPSCLVWPCLSSHDTPVRTADSVPLCSISVSLCISLNDSVEHILTDPSVLILSLFFTPPGAHRCLCFSSSASVFSSLVSCTCISPECR